MVEGAGVRQERALVEMAGLDRVLTRGERLAMEGELLLYGERRPGGRKVS